MRVVLVWSVGLGLIAAPGASAQAGPATVVADSIAPLPTPPPPMSPLPDAWAPPGAGDDGFTWVRLKTGEWVKGEIKDLRDGTLSFESDELDEFSYDWEDVTALVSSQPHTVTTWQRKFWTGHIVARRGSIQILDPAGTLITVVAPNEVSSMIQGPRRELNYWGGLVSAGSTIRSGNSDQKDLSLLLRLNRRALVNRWDNTFNFNYAEAGGSKNQENGRLTSKLDFFLSPNGFVTPADYEYFRDPFQNLAARHALGVAVGYDRNFGPASWDISVGTAWQYIEYESVGADADSATREWVGRLSTNLEWDLTADIEFDLDMAVNFPFEEAARYTSNLLSVLSLDLWWSLELDLTLAWDRQNRPEAAEDGMRPQKDDFRLTTGLAWEF